MSFSAGGCLGCLVALVGCLLGTSLILALCVLVVVIAVISGWSIFGTVMISFYGLTNFDRFADDVQNCVENSGDFRNDEFRRHHSLRLWIRLIYSLFLVVSSVLSGAVKAREEGSSTVRALGLVVATVILIVVCVTGEIVELAVWPFKFNYEMENCTLAWYQVGVYLGWPWYSIVLGVYGTLIACVCCACVCYACMGREAVYSGRSLMKWKRQSSSSGKTDVETGVEEPCIGEK